MAARPTEVEKYLTGIDYPGNKQDLLKQAEKNNAPQDVLNVLKQLPDEKFNRATDVTKAIGEIK